MKQIVRIITLVSVKDSTLRTTALCRFTPLLEQLNFTLHFVPKIEQNVQRSIIKVNEIYEPTISFIIAFSVVSSSSSSSLLSVSDESVRQDVDSDSSTVMIDSSKTDDFNKKKEKRQSYRFILLALSLFDPVKSDRASRRSDCSCLNSALATPSFSSC